jgi:hypothetical protein
MRSGIDFGNPGCISTVVVRAFACYDGVTETNDVEPARRYHILVAASAPANAPLEINRRAAL